MLTLRDIDKSSPENFSDKTSRLEIAGFYGDHAVFQYGKNTVLRGRTLPEKKVELTVGDYRLAIFSNQFGEFTFKIPPMKPASGLQMTISCGEEKLVFEDIAFGNVYIAGGQSNMELTMEQIAAMAIASIAEEMQEDVKQLRIVSFREVHQSSLERILFQCGDLLPSLFSVSDPRSFDLCPERTRSDDRKTGSRIFFLFTRSMVLTSWLTPSSA